MAGRNKDHLEAEARVLVRLISGIAGAFFILLALYMAYNVYPPTPPERVDGQPLFAPALIIASSIIGGVCLGFVFTYKKNRSVSKRILAHGGSILLAPAIPLGYLFTMSPEYTVSLSVIVEWHTVPGYVAVVVALCILASEYVVRGYLFESREV